MENENLIPEDDLYAREEKLQKSIRTIRKAVFMRVLVTVVLFFAILRFRLDLFASCLMILVSILNLAGMLPLVQEWRKRSAELKQLIALEE